MKLLFSSSAWDDYFYWQKTNKKILNRINTLIKEIQHNPLTELLKKWNTTLTHLRGNAFLDVLRPLL